ncbi:MAG: hypothetical protein LASZOEIN_002225 [Candidatus Fervidibacter sp.]|jgi:uncharacterized coiled-coil protein SlyX|nr:hypothetical protein [Armatimonadota bacterium]
MTTAIGIGLLALVIATLAVFVAAWRWLTRPAISEETIEALWNVIAELHDAVYRLEMNVAKLERMMAASNGKRSRITERSEGGEDW